MPTHHGRRAVLATLLEGLIEQAREVPKLVEVCVSDNASGDGTDDLMAEISRQAPCPVSYQRHTRNMGLAYNLLAAVEQARGRYCWLLGSDDLLTEGALVRACELVSNVPEVTGFVVGAVHVDADDPALRSRQLPRAFHPPGNEPRLIAGLDRVYDQCGNAWCALSWTLVNRELWLRAARSRRRLVLAHPIFPQVVVLASAATARPLWAWSPQPLVRQRNATTFLFEHGDPALADRWSQIISAAASAWAVALGGRRQASWRRRMRHLHLVWGRAEDVRATKLYDHPSVCAQAGFALALLGAFWPVRDYWHRVLQASLTPRWLTRLRYAPRAMARELEEPRLMLSSNLPDRMTVGEVAYVCVQLVNAGARTIRSEGPRAVTIGQLWYTSEGREVGPDQLKLNSLAALPQSIGRSLRSGRSLQAEIVLYAPSRPGLYRLELRAHQDGRGWLDPVDSYGVDEAVEIGDDQGSALGGSVSGSDGLQLGVSDLELRG